MIKVPRSNCPHTESDGCCCGTSMFCVYFIVSRHLSFVIQRQDNERPEFIEDPEKWIWISGLANRKNTYNSNCKNKSRARRAPLCVQFGFFYRCTPFSRFFVRIHTRSAFLFSGEEHFCLLLFTILLSIAISPSTSKMIGKCIGFHHRRIETLTK